MDRQPPDAGTVILQDSPPGQPARWLEFRRPVETVRADRIAEVLPALERIERATEAGRYAAGFVCYEAASAFDPALTTHNPGALPCLWFGIYNAPDEVCWDTPCGEASAASAGVLSWQPSLSPQEYGAAIALIHERIAAGETYQVNYTLRQRAPFRGNAWDLFARMCASQRGRCAAFLDLGEHAICSASPELFFTLDQDRIACRPMKGTEARGRSSAEDAANKTQLFLSAKNRAENLMIVDMVRNDLGRIAKFGSVQVPELFALEAYETVWQMTSAVTARTNASLAEIFQALFPCASITGAPKVKTSELIAKFETTPRGIYTGSIGYAAPNRRAQFNVAIRTVHVDRRFGQAEYGVGGGIVADSTPAGEYAECMAKSSVLTSRPRPPFDLLETLRWDRVRGFCLLDRHLRRLQASAEYWGYRCDSGQVLAALRSALADAQLPPQRVRLTLSENGHVQLQHSPLELPQRQPWRVKLAQRPVDPQSRWLYHKTTYRQACESARQEQPDCDDVILWNERGEITESTIANIVIHRQGQWLTPPVHCGLLPGTYRADLLCRGVIKECVIAKSELAEADGLFLINSVRGCIHTELS